MSGPIFHNTSAPLIAMSHRDTLLILTTALGAVGAICLLGLVMAIFVDGKARNNEQDPQDISPIDDIGYDRGDQ